MTAQRIAAAEIRALLVEVDEARNRLQGIAAEVAAYDPGSGTVPDRPVLALLAVDLHSFYTVFESLLLRVTVTLDGRTPEGLGSHVALLRDASRPLPGVRPALFHPSRRDALDEMRRFRHLFRHAYALDLEYGKLRRVLDLVPSLASGIDQDLGSLADFLDALVREIEGG